LIKLWISSKRRGVNKNPLGDGNIIAKGATKRNNVLKKIKSEGEVDGRSYPAGSPGGCLHAESMHLMFF
jgi:hypothetical protein